MHLHLEKSVWMDARETLSLDAIMHQATTSLIISGHTLYKFASDLYVKNALVDLLARNVRVTLVLLNPYSSYSYAHRPFHDLESQGVPYKSQMHKTIDFVHEISTSLGHPQTFNVYLTQYMPRFRTILIDDSICHVQLYMYGKDVSLTPELVITEQSQTPWFGVIRDSLQEMLKSVDVIPLIKDGRYNENWDNSQIADGLKKCLHTKCCRDQRNFWSTIETIILGYQNNPQRRNENGLYDEDYTPGTFTLDCISPATQYINPRMSFDRWLDRVLDDEIALIKAHQAELFYRYSESDLRVDVRRVLDLCRIDGNPLKCNIWLQEYSDIIRRILFTLLVNNPDHELNTCPQLTHERQELIIDAINWLEKNRQPSIKQWLHLSIAAGLLGINEKSTHAATSSIEHHGAIVLERPGESRAEAISRVGQDLWETANSNCRIDASDFFLNVLSSAYGNFKLAVFLDDFLESVVALKYYQELLRMYPSLEIDCIPRSIRCGNDATFDDLQILLPRFPDLARSNRFRIVEKGPKIGGVNLLKIHPEVTQVIDQASALDVRGARNYEMMQGIMKEAYFGFMVCREISESVTGLFAPDRPLIYIHHTPGERSFDGFKLRHERNQNGRMLAKTTVNDQKEKWGGGSGWLLHHQSDNYRNRYQILSSFYSQQAPNFHAKFGALLESEVEGFLDKLNGRVLVIGCGSGKEVEYLRQKGRDVWGFDFSPDAIALARQRNIHLKNRFFVEDLYNIDTIMQGEFDGIVANAVLLHLLDRDHLVMILEKIRARLKPSGLCFVRNLDKEGGVKEEFDSRLYYQDRWFVYYTEDELTQAARRAGFSILDRVRHRHAVHKGVYWLSLLLKNGTITRFNSLPIDTENEWDIFLGYASADTAELAQEVYIQLTEQTFHVFFAPSAVKTGTELPVKVSQALNHCRYFVALISPEYERSGWCKLELNQRVTRDTNSDTPTILPFLIGGAEIPSVISHLAYKEFPNSQTSASRIVQEILGKINKE
ncbi:MAG: methyltransferase domain-containing protein [Candidatus Zixiibacteriota bacterium]|nr:MAG: methyltransferase domain-containing protein [candidate division Zixibacteria bacterium]